METLDDTSVSTLVFCLSSGNTKSRVHFLPNLSAPSSAVSVTCKLTLFGKGIERKSVYLDGGRIGQPDGVRLEDAFPVLRGDAAGVFGLEIELSCDQTRLLLNGSRSVIEMTSPGFNVTYSSAPFQRINPESGNPPGRALPETGGMQAIRSMIGLQDAFHSFSLVAINTTQESLRPALSKFVNGRVLPLQIGTILGDSVVEIPLDEFLFRESKPQECSWGLVRAEGVHLDKPPPSGVAYYGVFRESATKKPVSICAL